MARPSPGRRLASALTILASIAAAPASAKDWPPIDPREPATQVRFDPAWALAARGVRDFGQLQQAAGAPGRMSQTVGGENPHAVYEWTSVVDGSRLRVMRYPTGDFGAVVTPAGAAEPIVFNNFGAFVCAACVPPVNACGHRPSWVPHDLHWDNFDCRCTLTGPQSLTAGSC